MMVLPFLSPAELVSKLAGPEGAKNLAGEMPLRLIQIRLTTSSFEKILAVRQDNSMRARIAASVPETPSTFSCLTVRLRWD
jgi:hypothetical protein